MLQNQEWSVGQGHWSGGRRFKNAFSVANCDALFLFIKLMSCLDSLRREGYIKDEHSPTLWISLLLYALSFLLSCFSGIEAIFQSWRKDDALAIRSQSRYRGAALIGFGRIHLNWLKVQIFTQAFDKLSQSLNVLYLDKTQSQDDRFADSLPWQNTLMGPILLGCKKCRKSESQHPQFWELGFHGL